MTEQALTVVKPAEPWRQRLIRSLLYGRNVDRAAKARARVGFADQPPALYEFFTVEEHVAFVPGRAAYVDGRGGSSMRLNFSGVDEDEIREGIRRLGEVIREQVALYGTLTGKPSVDRGASGAGPAGPPPDKSEAAEATEPALDNLRHITHKRAG